MENIKPSTCYERCNERYSAMQPQRLFCKKGCDFDENMQTCRTENCNKLCIKEQQGDQKLWFKFLYRAAGNPAPCLQSCIYGCHARQNQE